MRRRRPAGTELHKIFRDMVLFDFQARIHAAADQPVLVPATGNIAVYP